MNNIDIRHKVMASETTQQRGMTLMALHCSGADGTQWQHLAEYIEPKTELLLPDFVGAEATELGWSRKTYSLAEEAKPLIAFLRNRPAPSHLVGHSYGGGVALHIARHHPELVASLCLYEPTLFSLLGNSGPDDQNLFDEIEVLAIAIEEAINEGSSDFAAQVFTDFWGGVGAWQALSRYRRVTLTNWVRKCPLDFGALLYEPTSMPLPSEIPVTLMVGTQSQQQTQRIAKLLIEQVPQTRLVEVDGAGHLGPYTFRDRVARLVSKHFERMAFLH